MNGVSQVHSAKESARQSRRQEKLGSIPGGGEDPLREEMATCSSILAWRIPWTEEPSRLQSMGYRVRHDWACTYALPVYEWILWNGFVASLVAQRVKNPLTMQGTWVQPLGWADPLEEDMATHSSILARESPGQRSLQSIVSQRVRHNWVTKHTHTLSLPLQTHTPPSLPLS